MSRQSKASRAAQVETRWGRADVVRGEYGNGRLALQLLGPNGRAIAVLTVNLPEEELAEGEFFVKTWRENEGIAAAALASGLFVDTGRRVPTGFVEAQVWRFAESGPD
ncbi:MAG TPA: hypothetical protein VM285_17550 [Polyangia bacterium]|nr:hypothetical protein [Polyangia bacterium]